jgi:hypothetical protein
LTAIKICFTNSLRTGRNGIFTLHEFFPLSPAIISLYYTRQASVFAAAQSSVVYKPVCCVPLLLMLSELFCNGKKQTLNSFSINLLAKDPRQSLFFMRLNRKQSSKSSLMRSRQTSLFVNNNYSRTLNKARLRNPFELKEKFATLTNEAEKFE